MVCSTLIGVFVLNTMQMNFTPYTAPEDSIIGDIYRMLAAKDAEE